MTNSEQEAQLLQRDSMSAAHYTLH